MPTPDLVSLFVEPLNRLGVTYMVTGAVAAIVYGEPRLTNDIDLVIKLPNDDALRLHDAFPQPEFCVPPVETMQVEANRPLRGHFNLIHTDSALKADIYPAGSDPLHHWALEHRHQIEVSGVTMWIAPIEYVILRKLQYLEIGGQEKHRHDIQSMLFVSDTQLDREFLIREMKRMRLEEIWGTIDQE
jgi:hypothetical protein